MKSTLYTIILSCAVMSCTGFLDEKPSKDIDTPGSLESLQAILDNSSMNFTNGINVMMSDEYFSDDAGFLSFTPWHQKLYLWQADPFELEDLIFDWRDCYNQIQRANLVLEALEKNMEKNTELGRQIRGSALFYRANAYYNLSTAFLEGPNLEGKNINPTIPIRNSTSITLNPELAGKDEIESLIRADLEMADGLLADSDYLTRPSKKAIKALKARVYLSWQEYDHALVAAQEVLNLGVDIMDLKELDSLVTYPFTEFNQETIWYSVSGVSFNRSNSGFQVDETLYSMYQDNDLRKSLYYIFRPTGFLNFKGSYSGGVTLFSGLASDEVYLIYSECLVRSGDLIKAAEVLNELLATRHKDTFEPYSFDNETQALAILLKERRKELPFRGLRWTDLRRLNTDDRFKETLKRKYAGEDFILESDSKQYVLPAPARELSFY